MSSLERGCAKQQYLPHMPLQYGERRPANMLVRAGSRKRCRFQ